MAAFNYGDASFQGSTGGMHLNDPVVGSRLPLEGRNGVSSQETSEGSSHSRALYYRGGCSGRGGNWVDGIARQGSGANPEDEKHHLAKLRVGGSNPVLRSIGPA